MTWHGSEQRVLVAAQPGGTGHPPIAPAATPVGNKHRCSRR